MIALPGAAVGGTGATASSASGQPAAAAGPKPELQASTQGPAGPRPGALGLEARLASVLTMGDHGAPAAAETGAAARGPGAAGGSSSGFGLGAGAAGVASRLAGMTLGGASTSAPAPPQPQPSREGPQAGAATAGIVSGLSGVTLGASFTEGPTHAHVQAPRTAMHAGGTASAGVASGVEGVTLGGPAADEPAGPRAPAATPAGFPGSPVGAAPRAHAPAHARAPPAAPAALSGSSVGAGPHVDLAARFAAAVDAWDAGAARPANAEPRAAVRDAGAAAAGDSAGFVFSARGALRSHGMCMFDGCKIRAVKGRVVSKTHADVFISELQQQGCLRLALWVHWLDASAVLARCATPAMTCAEQA